MRTIERLKQLPFDTIIYLEQLLQHDKKEKGLKYHDIFFGETKNKVFTNAKLARMIKKHQDSISFIKFKTSSHFQCKSRYLLQEMTEKLCLLNDKVEQLIQIVLLMSSGSDSEELKKGSQFMQEQQKQMIQIPLVVLSSSDSELSQQQQPSCRPIQDPFEETVIERKRQSQSERQRRIKQVEQIYLKTDQREKSQLNNIKDSRKRRQSAQLNKQRQVQIKKQFPQHKHLPIEALSFVKQQLDVFSTHPICQFQNKEEFSEQLLKMRQNHRLSLFRSVILAREELKLFKGQKTSLQKKICDDSLEILSYAYRISRNIQTSLFKKLYKKPKDKKRGGYLSQLKVILRQFNDKNNIEFRRKILSNQYKMIELIRADQQSLMCQKSKQERAERQKQLIRQSEKIEDRIVIAIDEEEIVQAPTEPIHAMSSMRSMKSVSNLYDERDAVEEKRKKQKEDIIAKNKMICKKTYSEMATCMKKMRERTQNLNRYALNKDLLRRLKFDIFLNV